MPLARFQTGSQTSSGARGGSRPLVPGVEPGGSRAGKTKRVLLIRDMWGVLQDIVDADATGDHQASRLYLILSQDTDLNPALKLLVTDFHAMKTAAANRWEGGPSISQLGGRHSGTVWAPAAVGWQVEFGGGADALNWDLYLDYDVVEVPWMDWFIMWEFLDNVVDGDEEY